jgi:hypothetical protein
VDLDDVGPLDLAPEGPAAALVHPQERLQLVQGAAVDVEIVGQQLADGRALAGLVDGLGVAGLVEEFVGLAAGLGVRPEEGPHIDLKAARQLVERRALAEAV